MGRARASALERIALLFVLLCATGSVGLGGCVPGRAYPFGTVDAGGPDVNIGPCPTALIGYATVDGGTTGGGDVAASTATTLDALRTLAAQTVPAVIHISGTLGSLTKTDPVTPPVEVENDKTIVAAAPGDGLAGVGFVVKEKHNVIIRNVTIAKAFYPYDAITIQTANHVWVDHCDLSTDLTSPAKTYDDLIDVTHASDAVTISWTLFHDHISNATSLVGHSADNGAEDTGHLTVTYHHNLFLNTPNGSPRARFGHIHVFNNYYLTEPDGSLPVDNVYAIASTSLATLLIESNVFQLPAGLPIVTHWGDDPTDGTVWDLNNLYEPGDRQVANIITTPMNNWKPPYRYTADSHDSVPLVVNACAGVGKVP